MQNLNRLNSTDDSSYHDSIVGCNTGRYCTTLQDSNQETPLDFSRTADRDNCDVSCQADNFFAINRHNPYNWSFSDISRDFSLIFDDINPFRYSSGPIHLDEKYIGVTHIRNGMKSSSKPRFTGNGNENPNDSGLNDTDYAKGEGLSNNEDIPSTNEQRYRKLEVEQSDTEALSYYRSVNLARVKQFEEFSRYDGLVLFLNVPSDEQITGIFNESRFRQFLSKIHFDRSIPSDKHDQLKMTNHGKEYFIERLKESRYSDINRRLQEDQERDRPSQISLIQKSQYENECISFFNQNHSERMLDGNSFRSHPISDSTKHSSFLGNLRPHRRIMESFCMPGSPASLLAGERTSSDSTDAFRTIDSSTLRTPSRITPDEQKDATYWERRRKNNEAAKRSRDARRAKEDYSTTRAAILERKNLQLLVEMSEMKQEMYRLRRLLNEKTKH